MFFSRFFVKCQFFKEKFKVLTHFTGLFRCLGVTFVSKALAMSNKHWAGPEGRGKGGGTPYLCFFLVFLSNVSFSKKNSKF